MQPVAPQFEFRCLIWTQQRRRHINALWTCIAGLPPQVLWSPRQQHVGKAFPRREVGGGVHAYFLPLALVNRPHLCFLSLSLPPAPPLLFSSPPSPLKPVVSSDAGAETERICRQQVVQRGTHISAEDTTVDPVSNPVSAAQSASRILSSHFTWLCHQTWGIQTSSKVKGKLLFLSKCMKWLIQKLLFSCVWSSFLLTCRFRFVFGDDMDVVRL